MSAFDHPALLLLALPWLVFWGWLVRRQESALETVERLVSPRFRTLFSRYGRRSLRGHLAAILALGLLLVVAGARPTLRGGREAVAEKGRVLLILDASASMYAGDVAPLEAGAGQPENRFELARDLARGLVEELEGYRFALATFSGVTTLHLPMTVDRRLLEDALAHVEVHNYYQNTGSRISEALSTVFRFVDPDRDDLQVVLIGDGELPTEDDYEPTLETLADQRIPVHGLTVGSLEGEGRRIFDFRDVVAGKPVEERRVLRNFTTRREDVHLRRIARRTGGVFAVADRPALRDLVAAIRARPARERLTGERSARLDVTAWPLALFLAGFLLHASSLGSGRKRPDSAFDLNAIAPPRPPRPAASSRSRGAAAVALLAAVASTLSCADGPMRRAHRANERGIALDALRQHDAARSYYERSIGYRLEPEIPTYNLARSLTLQDRYSEAHELYQEAMKLRPDLTEAHYNDGMVLFRWGRAEIDPRGCDLERTLELWQGAERRFAAAAELAGQDPDLEQRARLNLHAVTRALAEIEALIAEPPPACQPPPSPPAAGGGDGQDREDEGEQAGGGGEEDDPGESGGGGEEDEDPGEEGGDKEEDEDPGEGSGGGEDERQGDGEPEQEGAGGGAGGPEEVERPLAPDELAQIEAELERIAAQAAESGKFHRRTRPEQFGRDSWSDPEAVIWW